MIVIIIIAIAIAIIFFLKLRGKNERITNETIVAEIGGLGSGKTENGSKRAIKLEKKQLKKWIQDKTGQPAPQLISNVPLQFNFKGKKYNSIELTLDHLLMKQKVPVGSVIFIDEIGNIISQYDWSNPNVQNDLTEFIRLYRQYTKGGYLVMTDQTMSAIVKPIRERVNVIVYNISTKSIGKLYCNQCSLLRFTSQIDSYTAETLDSLRQRRYGIHTKNYDTYAFSDVYNCKLFKQVRARQSDSLKVTNLVNIKQANTTDKGKEKKL